jgi:hypothetical protein
VNLHRHHSSKRFTGLAEPFLARWWCSNTVPVKPLSTPITKNHLTSTRRLTTYAVQLTQGKRNGYRTDFGRSGPPRRHPRQHGSPSVRLGRTCLSLKIALSIVTIRNARAILNSDPFFVYSDASYARPRDRSAVNREVRTRQWRGNMGRTQHEHMWYRLHLDDAAASFEPICTLPRPIARARALGG